MSTTIAALCAHLNIPVPAGKGDVILQHFKPLHEAGKKDVSFFDNQVYKHGARTTLAAAVLIREKDKDTLPETCVALVTPAPYVAFAKALQLMYPEPALEGGISQFAVVSGKATIHATARVEPYAVIYAGAQIGAHCHVGAHAVIGEGVTLGTGTRIGAHATLQKATVGAGCIIHPGVRIGQDGFGFAIEKAHEKETLVKVPQIGKVRIGNDVEIGANSTIDCGALGDTVIDDMVKIDNQVQIGHNVKIGRGSRIVAQVGVAGSATLGQFTVIGGQSGIAGHTILVDRVMVAARSGVTKSIDVVGQVVAGVPAVPIQEWRRTVAVLARLTKNIVQPNIIRNDPGEKSEPEA